MQCCVQIRKATNEYYWKDQMVIKHSTWRPAQRRYLILSIGRWKIRRVNPSWQKIQDCRVGGGIWNYSKSKFWTVLLGSWIRASARRKALNTENDIPGRQPPVPVLVGRLQCCPSQVPCWPKLILSYFLIHHWLSWPSICSLCIMITDRSSAEGSFT